MKDDIRRQTCIIIRKNGEYLVDRILGSKDLRWSNYTYEAYRTRNKEKAEKIARKVGGITMLFNPVTGDLRVM